MATVIQQNSVPEHLRRTTDLLGGPRLLGREPVTSLDVHDMLLAGLPTSALESLLGRFHVLHQPEVLRHIVGVTPEDLQRDGPLDVALGNRAWALASFLAQALDIFESHEVAERWLVTPAMGLNHRKPISLLATSEGIATVEGYLSRLEFGVYT